MCTMVLFQYFFTAILAAATYDYMLVCSLLTRQRWLTAINSIVGGGTAGLTIAARLTEDPKISILVLEAGNDHSNDTNVLSPGLYTGMYGNPDYDWDYHTVPR
jgi:hypothetical protein